MSLGYVRGGFFTLGASIEGMAFCYCCFFPPTAEEEDKVGGLDIY